jgi:hypothetical protein
MRYERAVLGEHGIDGQSVDSELAGWLIIAMSIDKILAVIT